MSEKTRQGGAVELNSEALDLIVEKAQELARAASAASPGPWLQPLEDEQRAIVSAERPTLSLLGLDRDGMAIFDREADAKFVVVARAHAAEISVDAIMLVDEVRRLRNCVERLIGERDAFQMATEEGSEIAACLTVERDALKAEIERLRRRDDEWQAATRCSDPDRVWGSQ